MDRKILHYLRKKKHIDMSNNHINYTFILPFDVITIISYITIFICKYHLKKPKTSKHDTTLHPYSHSHLPPPFVLLFLLCYFTFLYLPLLLFTFFFISTQTFQLRTMNPQWIGRIKIYFKKFYFLKCIYLALTNMQVSLL